ncbi:MAG: type VI secretion system baseplate subunit TssG [Planctomycetia bacterium]|nr:type VI secretion system baseplate subunit TssG [Planctomycetia bacterium]
MAGEHRTKAPDLGWLQSLEAEPFRFGFYQTLRRLEATFRNQPRIGYSARPRDESLRIGQVPTMAFAPSTLASFQKLGDAEVWRLQTYFFGLLGANGPLPLHLTEFAYERILRNRDQTIARFFDVFHHRFATYFYRAWADSQPTVQFDRPESDRFATYAGSLMGIGVPSLRNRDAMPDHTKLHFVGHLSAQTRHAVGLCAIVGSFLRVPAKLEEFVGHWLDLPADCRLKLGVDRACATLGSSAILGTRVWDRRQTFRLDLGPMNFADYNRLLPGGATLTRLKDVIRNYVGLTLRWDVRLTLKSEEIPRLTLGRQGKLGWTTWLGRRKPGEDARDLVLSRGLDAA